jgi:uncharacterized protein YprB with RNaseH-like and TPR domain
MVDDDKTRRKLKIHDLRKKLDAIDRKHAARSDAPGDRPEKPAPERRGPAPIVYSRDTPQHEPVRRRPRAPRGRVVRLAEAAGGEEVAHPEHGPALVIPTAVSGLTGAEKVSERFAEALERADSGLSGRLADVCDPAAVSPADVVFLDLETTGLASSPLFLVGTMTWEGGALEVRQYFARDYAEEAAAIALALEAAEARGLVVTFNGKTFDFPFLRLRAGMHHIAFGLDAPHLDLLHVCRRVWKKRLPDCKLQTLEAFVCRRTRYGDIAGSEIPEAYHDFVRTGNAWQIVEILRHNVLDLVTLADLMTRLPKP